MSTPQKKQYHTLYVLGGFIVFVVAWFVWQTPDTSSSNGARHPEITGVGENLNRASEFEPDAFNVTPSAQNQLESLRKRVVETPDDTTHLFRLARLLQDAHKPEEAARNYRHYLALHPDNYQAWLDMTQSFGQAKLWAEAQEAVTDMLAKYPDDPSALYNLGAVYANLGQMEEARMTWQKTIDQNKDGEVTILAQSSLQRLPIN